MKTKPEIEELSDAEVIPYKEQVSLNEFLRFLLKQFSALTGARALNILVGDP